MIQVQDISKSFGGQELFDGVSFVVGKGERVGLTGRNGSGKTTLFRIICGEEDSDGGSIDIPKRYTMGYLRQYLKFDHDSVLQEAVAALPENDYGYEETWKAEAILQGLGFSAKMQASSPTMLSGGYQVRLNLAKVLLSEPHMLLLDEPTNYLDIVSVRWLQRFLQTWQGELLLITHDREFMNSVCTHTVGIHRGKARKIQGDTEKLREQILIEEEQQMRAAANEARKREQLEIFINRFRAQANRAKAVQSRIKALARAGQTAELDNIADLDFQFSQAPFPGKRLLETEDLGFGYTEELLFSGLKILVKPGDRIGVIGPNGKGKTTLLRVILGELEAKTGSVTRSPNLKTGYFGQTNIDRLDPHKTITEEIISVLPEPIVARARTLAGVMMFEGDMSLKQINVLSGGERSRVLLAKLLAQPSNMLLLDEPTNHLDMESIDSLIDAVDAYSGAVIMVTHSEEMLDALCNRLLVFDGGDVRIFEGSYREFLQNVGWSEEKPASSGAVKPTTLKNEASAGVSKESSQDNHRQNAEKSRVSENSDSGSSHSSGGASDSAGSGLSKKEERRIRAEKLAERNKILKPLQKTVDTLEKSVENAENRKSELEKELLEASEAADGDKIRELSVQLDNTQKQIDKLFSEYEEAMGILEEKQEEFSD